MESMEEIYQNHSKKVYTFLLSKTCNHELAEELTQETFFCAVNSINKFKGNSSVLVCTSLCLFVFIKNAPFSRFALK